MHIKQALNIIWLYLFLLRHHSIIPSIKNIVDNNLATYGVIPLRPQYFAGLWFCQNK